MMYVMVVGIEMKHCTLKVIGVYAQTIKELIDNLNAQKK
jgi:hypothetical protein